MRLLEGALVSARKMPLCFGPNAPENFSDFLDFVCLISGGCHTKRVQKSLFCSPKIDFEFPKSEKSVYSGISTDFSDFSEPRGDILSLDAIVSNYCYKKETWGGSKNYSFNLISKNIIFWEI